MDTGLLAWLAWVLFGWIPTLAVAVAYAAIRYARDKTKEVAYWRERAERLECKHNDPWTIPPEDMP